MTAAGDKPPPYVWKNDSSTCVRFTSRKGGLRAYNPATAMPICPQCQKKYSSGDFSCPFCEVILESTGVFEKPQTKVPTMVELLLAQPGSQPVPGEEPKPPPSAAKPYDPDAETNPGEVALQPVPESAVIRILDVDLQEQSLSPYEAHFLAFIDRKRPARDIRDAAKLSSEQFATVVQMLTSKGVIEVVERTDAGIQVPTFVDAEAEPDSADSSESTDPDEEATPVPDVTSSDSPVPDVPEHAPPPHEETQPRAAERPIAARAEQVGPRSPVYASPAGPVAARPLPQPGRLSVTRMKPIQDKVRRSAVPEEAQRPIESRLKVIPLPPKRGEASASQGGAAVVVTPLEKAIELEKDGKWRDAVQVLETAIRKARSPSQLYNRLAIVLAKYRRDFKEAERLLNKAIEIEPENSVFQQNLIKVISMAASRDTSRGNR
jgi:hypothetical protein